MGRLNVFEVVQIKLWRPLGGNTRVDSQRSVGIKGRSMFRMLSVRFKL
jgi:hypothetical protein